MNPLLRRYRERFYQRHTVQTLLVLISMSLAIALVAAIELVNHSALTAMQYARAETLGTVSHQIQHRSDDRFDQTVYFDLRRRGLDAAPVLQTRLDFDTLGQLDVRGIDPIAESAFQRVASADEIPSGVLQAMLLGESVLLTSPEVVASRTTERIGEHTVELQPLLDSRLGRVVVGDIGLVQRLAQADHQLSRIDLTLDQTQALRLAETLDPQLQLTTTQAGEPGADGMIEAFQLNLRALSLLSLLVACLLVAGSMRFLVLQRAGDFATLRTLGQCADQQTRGLLSEAIVLGLIAALIGLLLGYWLASELLAMTVRTLSDVYLQSLGTQLAPSPRIALIAIALGLAASIGGAWLPITELHGQSVAGALSGQLNERLMQRRLPRLAGIGAALVGAGILLVMLVGNIAWAFAGLFFLAIGCSLLSLQIVAVAARKIARYGPGFLRLPATLLKGASARLGSGLIGLSLAVATVISIAIMISTFRTSTEEWLDASLYAPLYLSTSNAQPLDAQDIDHIRQWPETALALTAGSIRLPVASVGQIDTSVISQNEQRLDAFQVIRGPDPSALSSRWNNTASVLVSESLGRRQQWPPGTTITLDSGRELTVVAWVRDYRSPIGRMFVHWQTASHLELQVDITSVGLIPASGQVQALTQRLQQWRDDQPQIELYDRARIREQSMQIFDQTFRITHVLRSLAAIVAALALLGALLNWQVARAGDLALLRAMGLSTGGLLRLLLAQSALIGLLTGALALPVGIALSTALIKIINVQSFGWSMQLHLTAGDLLHGLLLALIAALAAALPAALYAARLPPARHLGARLT